LPDLPVFLLILEILPAGPANLGRQELSLQQAAPDDRRRGKVEENGSGSRPLERPGAPSQLEGGEEKAHGESHDCGGGREGVVFEAKLMERSEKALFQDFMAQEKDGRGKEARDPRRSGEAWPERNAPEPGERPEGKEQREVEMGRVV
jgi:hypothetical protein